jgi:hypothetical protein
MSIVLGSPNIEVELLARDSAAAKAAQTGILEYVCVLF